MTDKNVPDAGLMFKFLLTHYLQVTKRSEGSPYDGWALKGDPEQLRIVFASYSNNHPARFCSTNFRRQTNSRILTPTEIQDSGKTLPNSNIFNITDGPNVLDFNSNGKMTVALRLLPNSTKVVWDNPNRSHLEKWIIAGPAR